MEKLSEKKRRWIVNQFRSGRGATSIARIQKISRQRIYKLAARHTLEGIAAYAAKKPGRKKIAINPCFVKKVVERPSFF